MDLGIEGDEELQELCQHYNCKWYDLTFIQLNDLSVRNRL